MRYTDLIEAACAELAEAPQQAQGCANIRLGYRRRGVEQHIVYFRPTSYGNQLIASHPLLEGRRQRSLITGHRRQQRATTGQPATPMSRGERVALYDAIGRRLAAGGVA